MTSPIPNPAVSGTPANASSSNSSLSKLNRIAGILSALSVFAAEFGPLWIHSVHGTETLQKATGVLAAVSAIEEAAVAGQ